MSSFRTVFALCSLYSVTAFVPNLAFTVPQSTTSLNSSVRSPNSDTFNSYFSNPEFANAASNINNERVTAATTRERTTNAKDYTRELEERLKALENDMGKPNKNIKSKAFTAPKNQKNTDEQEVSKFRDNTSSSVIVQGDSLKTWGINGVATEKVYIRLTTEGRPLDATVELWQGPDNTPQKLRIYNEDGSVRPFSCVMMTPRGPNTLAVRNTGPMEFPMGVAVSTAQVGAYDDLMKSSDNGEAPRVVQGGALRTYPFDSFVESVQVMLKNDGRPMNARVELMQGPNNNKQVIEIFSEDADARPFFAVIETPGSGNVIRVVNTSPVEFPLTASVEAYIVSDNMGNDDVVLGGDSSNGSNGPNW